MFSDQVSLPGDSHGTKTWPAGNAVEEEHLPKLPSLSMGKELLWRKWNTKTTLGGHQWGQGESDAGGEILETLTVKEKQWRTSEAGQEEHTLVATWEKWHNVAQEIWGPRPVRQLLDPC